MASKRNETVTLICPNCGSAFHPWRGREKTSKSCSIACDRPRHTQAMTYTHQDFLKQVNISSECWEWVGTINARGYGLFHFNKKSIRAHRYSFSSYRGSIPMGLFVCHVCDNRRCVRPSHLWVGTHNDNMKDMAQKGRANTRPKVHSEAHPLSKITKEIARNIREDKRSGRKIAAEYSVSKSLVHGIKKGTHWKYA